MKNFTLITLGFLLGAVTIAACSKSAPTIAPVVPIQNVLSVDARTATVAAKASAANDAAQRAQTKAPATAAAPVLAPHPSPVAKAKVRGSTAGAAEKAAYDKAAFNAWRANCLNVLVDMKVATDQAHGEISDWGSVLKAGVCDSQ